MFNKVLKLLHFIKLKLILRGLLALFVLWIAGYISFIRDASSYTSNNTVTDAIVVFVGGKQRVDTGLKLLKAGYAPIIIMSGLSSDTQLKNFLVEKGVNLSQVVNIVVTDNNQDLTEASAKEAARFIIDHDIDSIRIVTSDYNMKRALKEAEKFLSPKVSIIPHPVISPSISYITLFKEYNKYLFLIGFKS